MISLDSMLNPAQAARWLGMSRRQLMARCAGRKPAIPAIRISSRVFRFCPRIIIGKLAADAGVNPAVIASAMGVKND
jgi:hypothetical protein